jgi:hypothetical protein
MLDQGVIDRPSVVIPAQPYHSPTPLKKTLSTPVRPLEALGL